MEVIDERKKLELLKEDVLRKEQARQKYSSGYYRLSLVSVEENIGLWKKRYFNDDKEDYFYTDLEGNLLFDGRNFQYATPFYHSLACVNDRIDGWYLMDIRKKQLVSLPKEISFDNINGFRQENLALFDKEKRHWGSYCYTPESAEFREEIPFIWDNLEFSRDNGFVYTGLVDRSPICFGADKRRVFQINVVKLPIDKAYDLSYYQYLMETYRVAINQNTIRYITEELEELYSQAQEECLIQAYIGSAYSLSDYYFEERDKKEYQRNDGAKVELGTLGDYQKVLAKVVK